MTEATTEQEPKPAQPTATRRAKPKQTPTTGQQKAKGGQPAAKPKANGQATQPDKAQLRLAAQVVKLREDKGMSWAAIGFQLKLVDAGKSNAGGAARRLFKLVKGAEASTARLVK